jgi:hypothetical protein
MRGERREKTHRTMNLDAYLILTKAYTASYLVLIISCQVSIQVPTIIFIVRCVWSAKK